MAHFAKINDKNIVIEVIVADQSYIDSLEDKNSYIQTSYNTRAGIHWSEDGMTPSGKPGLRKNFAGLNFSYDLDRDAFIPPKPFASWILDEDTCLWKSPIPHPGGVKEFIWDENIKNWVPMFKSN